MSESKTVIYSPDSGMAGGNGMMAMKVVVRLVLGLLTSLTTITVVSYL